jgi:hypothetical protein
MTSTTPRVVELRGWPGTAAWRAPQRQPGDADRLGDRNALVLHAAADADRPGDEFGLGGALLVAGRSVVGAVLILPDDLEAPRRGGLEAWAAAQRLRTPRGPVAWQVATLRQFFDPKATARQGAVRWTPNAYGSRRLVVGADLGRTLGLVAEHAAPGRKAARVGAWSVYPVGWGAQRADGTWHRAFADRPELVLRARRVGWQVRWGPTDAGRGRRGGAFLDLLTAAYALDGERGASFSEHRAAYGLEPGDLPLRVPVDETGADAIAAALGALHELAVMLDERGGDWLACEEERADGRGRLDLAHLASPGGVAEAVAARFGLRPPLETFDLGDAEHGRWAEALHGGRNEADPSVLGVPIPAAACDLTSAFAACAHLLGWWPLACAERLEREDVAEELRALCEAAITDPAAALDPVVWGRLGFTLAVVRPDGEPWPVALEDERRPDGRLELAEVFSPDRPLPYAWPDVVAAAIASGRVPDILGATRLVPVGRQRGLRRRVALVPGLVLDLEEDPGVAIGRFRQAVKGTDPALAAELRVVLLALCFGSYGRLDPAPGGGERPGPRTFLPVPATIFAGARLLLGTFETLVRNRGGLPIYAATDAWLVPASPAGGEVLTPAGARVPLLPWAALDEVIATFDRLRVFGEDVPAWSVERGSLERPLRTVVWGPLRHAEFLLGDDGEPMLADWTGSGLGARYAAPPGSGDWTRAAVLRAVRVALGLDPSEAPWDAGSAEPFPAIRRLRAVMPEVLASLPPALGARPGSRFLATQPHPFLGAPVGPVALDPGGDLADWASLDWRDRRTGEVVRPTTDPAPGGRVVESLAGVAAAALRPRRPEPVGPVVVDPDLVVHKGRVSGVIDADVAGLGDLAAARPLYDDGERLEAVQRWARALGKRAFARRTGLPLKVAERAALGRPIAARSVRRALRALRVVDASTPTCPVDGRPIFRAGARFCSARCRNRVAKARQRARAAAGAGATR